MVKKIRKKDEKRVRNKVKLKRRTKDE